MAPEPSVKPPPRWTPDDVRRLIRKIVSGLAPAHPQPAPESRLVEDLGCNSLSLLQLLFALEDEFDLPTVDETARKIATVHDIEQHVLMHLRSTGQLNDA